MSKKMLINASHPEENRVAIVVDGILSELDIELAGQEQTRGNIYKAVVVRVETGLQAAFIDYGADKLGFLQISEIHPGIYPARDITKNRPRIADILHRGQEILIQVVKEERGNKGAALTTFLSLPGRYMVLMPDSTTKGVSRKITEESQRKTLKKTMAELKLPEQMGYIVRTAGIGKDKEELKRDFDYLVRLYEGIIKRKEQVKAPAQLYQESNLAIRSIRDYFSTDMDEVLVDDEKIYQDARDFFSLVMPELSHLVKRHRERRPIFSRYQIEEQIDSLAKNQIPMPSGGSIVIDPTEALVAIDVNSGKMSSESGIEATAVKTNLEAAAEIGRQLRLRDLGGLIVIDFIDMRDRKHIREVEQELRKALKNDKAKVSVGRISQFGLLEMSRQRIKPVLSVGAYLPCPHCHGIGRIKSIEAQAVNFLRQAHTAAAKGQVGLIEARVPFDVANYLLNQKRTTIGKLEDLLGLKITILGQHHLLPGELQLETFKREAETSEKQENLPVSHANQIEMALAEAKAESENPQQTEQASATPEDIADDIPTQTLAEQREEPAPKKRRRRRRKKPAPPTDAASQQPADTTRDAVSETAVEATPATEVAAAETDEPDQPATEPVTAQTPEAPTKNTGEPEEIPKKRSRRPRKPAAKKTAAEKTTAQATDSAQPAPPAADPAPATAPEAQPKPLETVEEAPKKRTRRPRKPAAKKATTEEVTAQATDGAQAAPPATAEPAPAAAPDTQSKPLKAEEEAPKKRAGRPRKSAAKKTAATEKSLSQPPETTS